MDIIGLEERDSISENAKLSLISGQFKKLLSELRNKELPNKFIESVNMDIEELNSTSHTGNELKKFFKQKQTKIIKMLEKEFRIVPRGYYAKLWMLSGMTIGLPIGVAYALIFYDNVAFLGTGMCIGMGIGSILGSRMDKKASEEGRQLDITIK